MPEASRSTLLSAYRGLTTIAYPLAGPLLAWRVRHGKEDPDRCTERRGIPSAPRPEGPLVWVHAASVGETVSVLPLVRRIVEAGDVSVLLTTGTVTSAEIAEAGIRALPADCGRVIHQYVPLDSPRFVRRFLAYWRPGLAVFVESEIWPNILTQVSDTGAGLALVNARMSDRSFARWQKRPAAIAMLLSRFDICLAQSERDAERLRALGAPRVVDTGNLKYDVPPPGAEDDELRRLSAAIEGRPRWAAASLHAGEDVPVLEAHVALAGQREDLVTILVPRHPDRGTEIAAAAEGLGLNAALRSQGRVPEPETDVYVFDTIGEMGLVYRLAQIVFIGGSLVDSGGHNPIEAAKLTTAILHGPYVGNTTDIYAALHAGGGAEEVADAEGLALRVGELLSSPDAVSRYADAAQNTVKTFSSALDHSIEALEPLIAAAKDR